MTKDHSEIIYPVIYLYCVGWLELLRLTPDLARKQSLWLFIACGTSIVLFRLLNPITLLERYRTLTLVGGLLLLFSALLLGTEVNGAKLWLRVGDLSFQPIEIVKVILVVTLASFWRRFRLWMRFSKNRASERLPKRGMLFLALGWFLGLAILVVQRDLGMALLLIGVLFTMFYVSTGRRDFVVMGVGGFFAASVLAILAFDHVRIRIRAWWDPFHFFETDGYQLVQGLYAVADGGPWGRGLFLGRPHFIPESHTDFILLAVAQELGWITALCLIFCTAYMGYYFFRLASECGGEFRRLLLTGLASLWSIQCFIILGGTTKIIPMTGLTLPFVSYGGSSLLANAILIALIVRGASRGEAGGLLGGNDRDKTFGDCSIRRIRKVAGYHLYLFLLPALSLLFYGWLRAPHLNERPDNPLRSAPLHLRGRILDQKGLPLADTLGKERRYPANESAGSLVGYYLRGRNQTGLEASLQKAISPPLPPRGLQAALQQDREAAEGDREGLRGPDARLTLDLDLQRKLYQALAPKSGAVVVADSRGRILAAVSSPSFDPNTVGENWHKLRSDPQSPFIERVGSGLYPVLLPNDNSPLMKQQMENHPWFWKEPFPAYPGSSSALWMEERLFLTPLMLLQYSFSLSGHDSPPSPSLLTNISDLESLPSLGLVSLTPIEQSEGMTLWSLKGPPFRESPEFLAFFGNFNLELYFAVVVESADSESLVKVYEEILPSVVLHQEP